MSAWHEEYLKRYAQLKERGRSFFPYAVFKDVIVSFLLLCVLSALAYFVGAELGDLADPTDTTYNPRPEWYFMFLFQVLKLFPGRLEAVAAVVLPVLVVLFLFSLPLIDRGRERHPSRRPLLTGIALMTIIAWGFLTWKGYTSPLTNPIVEKDPLVLAGHRLYQELKCSYCHSIGGQGGLVGPELDKVVGEQTEEWLKKHFRDPQTLSPGTVMPKLNLLDDEITVLVAYMKSLGSGPFTEEAPKLFNENCTTCHRIGKEGGDVGPNLSAIGSVRSKSYIKSYIEDPSRANNS
ncbi:MAG: c-type cytochrome, partial [Ignavibacteriales bacterium]|nr:c-type cytochrome [Ignavibacteriales bacterium]